MPYFERFLGRAVRARGSRWCSAEAGAPRGYAWGGRGGLVPGGERTQLERAAPPEHKIANNRGLVFELSFQCCEEGILASNHPGSSSQSWVTMPRPQGTCAELDGASRPPHRPPSVHVRSAVMLRIVHVRILTPSRIITLVYRQHQYVPRRHSFDHRYRRRPRRSLVVRIEVTGR